VFVSGLYYVGGLTAWSLWRRRVRLTASAESVVAAGIRRCAAFMTAISAIWIVAEPWTAMRGAGDGRLHVTFIDVGQGDSAFVRFPRGATLLVDAGGLPGSGSFDIGDRVVAPVLRSAGIRRLGTVALTHGDSDHVGGASAAILEFRPWEVWEGIPVPRSETLQAIHDSEDTVHTQSRTVQTDDSILVDGVSVIVRHPKPPDWERQDVRNDDSIVLELLWRDVSIVFTGDIGAEVERAIAPDFHPAPLRVLKVPHHGSLTSSSSAFVQALAPRVAVVSVGRSNHFGHPAPVVLQRYQEVQAEVFRTDRDSAVTVDSDGKLTGRPQLYWTNCAPHVPSREQRRCDDTAGATKTRNHEYLCTSLEFHRRFLTKWNCLSRKPLAVVSQCIRSSAPGCWRASMRELSGLS
jgi:beta-lactamase superfamily II metal-dependent hydrolase